MEQITHVADSISKDCDFFPKIVNLFRKCKDLGDRDGLHMIFRLVKAVILLNSSAIFDKILSDAFILDIIGVLECKHNTLYRPFMLYISKLRSRGSYCAKSSCILGGPCSSKAGQDH